MKNNTIEKLSPYLGVAAAFATPAIVLIMKLQPPDGLRTLFLDADPVFQFAVFLLASGIVLLWLWWTARKFFKIGPEVPYQKATEELEQQIATALKPRSADEKAPIVWTRKFKEKVVPDFIPKSARHTRIVSVINLKGGVGKTTLTANLAGWLAKQKKFKVLVVDLDFQSTLTEYIAGFDNAKGLSQRGQTSSNLHVEGFSGSDFPSLLQDFPGAPESYLIGASSYLETVDTARQNLFVYESRECRFDFRRIFHDSAVYGRFNVILFDCPPRLTVSSVNALVCSDGYLVPTLPDTPSVFAVENLITRAKLLNPSPELLGIVLNRADRDKFSEKRKAVLNRMQDRLETEFGVPRNKLFEGTVKHRDSLATFAAVAPDEHGPSVGQIRTPKSIPAIASDEITTMLDDFGNEFCARLGL
ncbi:MAG: cellulose biosynthesis protein BcsQ [Verrucomicrobiales bacterium]|jgi:cellulose biosynthesis protein BcsQ